MKKLFSRRTLVFFLSIILILLLFVYAKDKKKHPLKETHTITTSQSACEAGGGISLPDLGFDRTCTAIIEEQLSLADLPLKKKKSMYCQCANGCFSEGKCQPIYNLLDKEEVPSDVEAYFNGKSFLNRGGSGEILSFNLDGTFNSLSGVEAGSPPPEQILHIGEWRIENDGNTLVIDGANLSDGIYDLVYRSYNGEPYAFAIFGAPYAVVIGADLSLFN